MTTLQLPRRTGTALWLRELEGAPLLGHVLPSWFASVMGTGIVAVAAAGLPVGVPGLQGLAVAAWVLAAVLLVLVLAATGGHWMHHRATARRHLDDPVAALFYGAPAMALMTVGAGTLLVGHRVVGLPAAVAVDAMLWSVGTLFGLATTVLVPLRVLWIHGLQPDTAFGGWLMPVVPPMVSAATGAALVPHLPAGPAQQAMLVVCWSFFGLTLVTSAVMIGFILRRLVRVGPGAAAGVPTLFIVLGPMGQSVTAAHHLGVDGGTRGFTLAFGLPMLGLALVWLFVAATIVVRAARNGLPFSLTWWSFTFPLGTVVTGASGLAALTGNPALQSLAVGLFVLLLTAWTVVATRTAHGVVSGRLLRRP
ncbi:C4-dicarboxylate ABC transporter [Aeromicrobium sp. Root495]|uniref:TDT family transporter n=1 Tax=Aeromicrobium sp. Root495 TaxID=1736550 RepID=UPI0006FD684F|nr:TDT family transporter [Aeromicrobium sp. Root495]KQY58465.1 C4-dicarboxylate ABC transporter [Aeromicrobium sp. Root495]